MIVSELVDQLASLRIALSPLGDQLRIIAPRNAVTSLIRQQIIDHKPAILQYLQNRRNQLPAGPQPVFIDLESRSCCDLRKYGGHAYAADSTTEVLSVAAIIDDRAIIWFPSLATPVPTGSIWPEFSQQPLPVACFVGADMPAPLLDVIKDGRWLCAHNCFDFDRPVWRGRGLPEPAGWFDTLPASRAAGLPGKLELLGQRLLGRGKDPAGEALLAAFSRPNKHGHFRPLNDQNAIALGRYNLLDVLLCREVYARFGDCLEPDVVALDQTINERGIEFDQELARAIIRTAHEQVVQAGREAEHATAGEIRAVDLTRTHHVLAWLRNHGLQIPNLQRATLERMLQQGQLSGDVRAVLEGRLTATRKTTTKLERGLEHVSHVDSRLRHLLVYHKAHTGRWAGRLVQPQNLPRPAKSLGDVARLIPVVGKLDQLRDLLPAGVSVDDTLSGLIRPCFRAAEGKVLVIADFSAIEARGVAWCASEQSLLAKFAAGEDVYSDFATLLFGRPISKRDERERSVGKVAMLGCGYGMGPDRFGETCKRENVDLASVGLTAERVVGDFRDAYPAIAGTKIDQSGRSLRVGGLWRDLEEAFGEAVRTGQPKTAGWCQFMGQDRDLVVYLPSGRKMYYRDTRIELVVLGYAAKLGLPPTPKETIVYTDTQNLPEQLYGGKITENVVSAICRDLQVAAMQQIERAGIPIVLHVHDEIVAEVPADEATAALQEMLRIMSTAPAWAVGFPIQAEGFISPRYVKSPPAGTQPQTARGGLLLAS